MFVGLHGGAIRFEPAENGGSRFVITLSRAIAATGDAPAPAVVITRSNTRVVLVEDNADACEMLRAALEDAGHVVATAGNSDDAMGIADEFRPDVGISTSACREMTGISSPAC
jgi:two-component system, sensor histidine kinase